MIGSSTASLRNSAQRICRLPFFLQRSLDLINQEKSQIAPTQEITYWGMRINSEFSGFSLPKEDRVLPLVSTGPSFASSLLSELMDECWEPSHP